MDRRQYPLVDGEVLAAAVSIYLLLGVTWAMVYAVTAALDPGAFTLAAGDSDTGWTRHLYLSLVTLTTLGYGDLVPLSPFARICTALEAVTGVLFTGILIARLVGLYGRRRPDADPEDRSRRP